MEIKVDLGWALRKTAALAKTPKAAKACLERWGARSVEALMRSAASLQKTARRKKSGGKSASLSRNIQHLWANATTHVIGTNLRHESSSSKYASIQDTGGTIHAKKKMLTIPLPGVDDTAKDHPNAFIIKTKKGNVLLVEEVWAGKGAKSGKGYSWAKTGKRGWRSSGYKPGIRALFLLKPEVTLPATHWFTGTMRMMEALLPDYMDEKVIYEEAAKMAGMGGEA